jgi:hypothetical protein
MEIVLIILLIIVIIVLSYITYNLLTKTEKLEDIAIKQNMYVSNISAIIEQTDLKLKELDSKEIFKSDDEIGFFFNNVKEIQTIINQFKIETNAEKEKI